VEPAWARRINEPIVGNTLTENGGGVYLGITDSSSGNMPSDNNLVEGNIISESGGPGIELAGSSNSTVSGNQLIDNVATFPTARPLADHADNTLVRGGDLRASQDGIAWSSSTTAGANDTSNRGTGISLRPSLNNQLIDNTSSNNISLSTSAIDRRDFGMLIAAAGRTTMVATASMPKPVISSRTTSLTKTAPEHLS
jgi:parallel beta-helix repeat protein